MATNKQCISRLQKEYKAIQKEPVHGIVTHPNPANLLEWHYTLEGAKDTEYKGGVYHGKIVFPAQYPFKPPSISMITPNGRFAVNTKLCLSMTDFHPESWNPMWSVGTILTGLLSFFHASEATTGSIVTSTAEKQRLATESLAWNMRTPLFRKLFPEWVAEWERRQEEQAQAAAGQQGAEAAAGEVQGGAGAKAAPGAGAKPQAQAAGQGVQGGGGGVLGGGQRTGAGAKQQGSMASTLLTVAVVVVVLAYAAVPLFTSSTASTP